MGGARVGDFSGAERDAVRCDLEQIVLELESLGARLRAIHSGLPVSPREDLMLLGEEEPDDASLLRGAIECAVNDHLRIVIGILRDVLERKHT